MQSLGVLSQVAVSILLEATPFLLLGSLASGFFEVFAPSEAVLRVLPRRALPGVLVGLVLGFLLPCCECGVVPLIRRFLAKGVPTSTAMTYMLAGPVINPVVMVSTYVAFQGDWGVVWLRLGFVAVVAAVIGFWFKDVSGEALLAGTAQDCREPQARPGGSTQVEAGGLFGSLDDALPLEALTPGLARKTLHALEHALSDFLGMGRILLVGALVAAAFKTFAPSGLMTLVEKDLLLSVMAMMGLAVVLSLCSQADAFVAASFSGFPLAARLAFLVLGPILDFKLVLMWGGAFRPWVVRVLIVVPLALVFGLCMTLGFFLEGVKP